MDLRGALGRRVRDRRAKGGHRRATVAEAETIRILQDEYVPVPAKKVPVRVVKYDLNLRDASVRAVQAVHAMLSRVVEFECQECLERFPAFHLA